MQDMPTITKKGKMPTVEDTIKLAMKNQIRDIEDEIKKRNLTPDMVSTIWELGITCWNRFFKNYVVKAKPR